MNVVNKLHDYSVEVGHAQTLLHTPRSNHYCCMRKHEQVMQVASVQEHEEVDSQRHVDFSQWYRGEKALHTLPSIQVAFRSACKN